MEEKKYGWATSSIDANRISLSIKGVAKLLPALIVLAGVFGVSLDLKELDAILNSFLGVLAAGVALWGAAETSYGLIRKLLVRLNLYAVE